MVPPYRPARRRLATHIRTRASRLTKLRPIPGNGGPDAKVCRALGDRFAVVLRHPGGDEGRVRSERADALRGGAHALERAGPTGPESPGLILAAGRYGHHAEEAHAGGLEDVLDERLEVAVGAAAAA